MIHRSFDITTAVRGISRQPTSVALKASPLRTEHLRGDPLLLEKLFHALLQTLTTTRTYSGSYSWQGTQRGVAAEAAQQQQQQQQQQHTNID
ncbi:unnamed protein product [Ectocarpus sp. 6 AP-2014]